MLMAARSTKACFAAHHCLMLTVSKPYYLLSDVHGLLLLPLRSLSEHGNRHVRVQNADRLDSEIIYDRDFDYDYFGFKVC